MDRQPAVRQDRSQVRQVARGALLRFLAAVMMLGCGSSMASAEVSGLDGITVSRYLQLQARAEHETEAALLLGGYIAGLFTGLVHVSQGVAPQRIFCSPPDLNPELRDVLNFLDESLEDFRHGLRDGDETLVRDVLLDALIQRFPCAGEQARDEEPESSGRADAQEPARKSR